MTSGLQARLKVGGDLHAARADQFVQQLCMADGTFLHQARINSMVSIRSFPREGVLSMLREGTCTFTFASMDTSDLDAGLEAFLVEHGLDFSWRWGVAHRVRPGFRLHDGRTGEGARFSALDGDIVLTLAEIDTASRLAEARAWASWSPRQLRIFDSAHDLVGKVARAAS